MKVTVNNQDKEEVIDWNKVRLVEYNKSKDHYIVLTNGKNTSEYFEGSIVYSNIHDEDEFTVGQYNNCLFKKSFKPFHGSITLQND